jgi:hypothetical protein
MKAKKDWNNIPHPPKNNLSLWEAGSNPSGFSFFITWNCYLHIVLWDYVRDL